MKNVKGYKTIAEFEGIEEAEKCLAAKRKIDRIAHGNARGELWTDDDEVRYRKMIRCLRWESGVIKTHPYTGEVNDNNHNGKVEYELRGDGKERPEFGTDRYNAFCHTEDEFGYVIALIGWKSAIKLSHKKELTEYEKDFYIKFRSSLLYVSGGAKQDPWGKVNCAWCGKGLMNNDLGPINEGKLPSCPGSVKQQGTCSYNINKHRENDESWIGLMWKFIQNGLKCTGCNTATGYRLISQDHDHPTSKGGGRNPDNVRPLCLGCNGEKKASENWGGSVVYGVGRGLTDQDAILDMMGWMDFYKIPERCRALIDGKAVEFHTGETDAAHHVLKWYNDHKHMRAVDEQLQLVRTDINEKSQQDRILSATRKMQSRLESFPKGCDKGSVNHREFANYFTTKTSMRRVQPSISNPTL